MKLQYEQSTCDEWSYPYEHQHQIHIHPHYSHRIYYHSQQSDLVLDI